MSEEIKDYSIVWCRVKLQKRTVDRVRYISQYQKQTPRYIIESYINLLYRRIRQDELFAQWTKEWREEDEKKDS